MLSVNQLHCSPGYGRGSVTEAEAGSRHWGSLHSGLVPADPSGHGRFPLARRF